MRNTVRTFIAVELPPEIRQRASTLIERLQGTEAKVKWVRPEEMHWTLKFLGEVDLVDIPQVCQRVGRAAARLHPFDVEAFGAGAFPDPYHARTVWLGMRDGAEQMVALHNELDTELAALGFRAEQRRFRPHLTIGRVRGGDGGRQQLGDLIQSLAEFDGGVSTAFEVVVFASHLGHHGPTYEPLGHSELGG